MPTISISGTVTGIKPRYDANTDGNPERNGARVTIETRRGYIHIPATDEEAAKLPYGTIVVLNLNIA